MSILPSLVIFCFAGIMAGILGIVHIVNGRGVSKGRSRILQSILSVMWLGNFPFGTIFGGFGLWVCWVNEETKTIFEEGGLID